MKIFEALLKSRKELELKGVESNKLDSLILLSYALSFSKEQIIFNPDLELTASQEQAFFELVARRTNREPISHIIKKREFYGEDFMVSGDVLDPRPDSESLIELVLENFSNKNQELKILELGCGSGCLIITLLRLYKNSTAISVDISKKALEIASQNACKHKAEDRLQLMESDLFANLKNEKFDFIISNPPYIPSKEIENLQDEVKKYEPRIALDGGLDGLDFYRRIANNSADFLNENGGVFLEIGFGQEDEITKIFQQNNFYLIATKPDLSSVIRGLYFKKSK